MLYGNQLFKNNKRSKILTVAHAREAAWLPGSDAPVHLDGKLIGDFGFDPLGLGKDPRTLTWYHQAELQHSRWAMLAVAGILVQTIIKPEVSFIDAGSIIAESTYAPFGTLLVIQILLMGWAESRRWQDMHKPGSTSVPAGNFLNLESAFGGKRDTGYPGGIFDPAGFSENSDQLKDLKLKEIKNGRLAMLAYLGISCGSVSTGKNPIEALQLHISDPWSNNVMSNSYALPFLPN